jgi:hypothetical protein
MLWGTPYFQRVMMAHCWSCFQMFADGYILLPPINGGTQPWRIDCIWYKPGRKKVSPDAELLMILQSSDGESNNSNARQLLSSNILIWQIWQIIWHISQHPW